VGKKQLVRELKRAALERIENAARTESDFNVVIKQWDNLDENRERRERGHEIKRNEETIRLGYTDGMILPIPFLHPTWRGIINGDFLDLIYDNAEEMWQLVEDADISMLIKALTAKQKEVLFLSAVRGCSPQQIACYKEQTDRAIRKLLVAALIHTRDNLVPIILEQINNNSPNMTCEKKQFIEGHKKTALDNAKRE